MAKYNFRLKNKCFRYLKFVGINETDKKKIFTDRKLRETELFKKSIQVETSLNLY